MSLRCPMCMKSISARAKICPWCHTDTLYGKMCVADPSFEAKTNKFTMWFTAVLFLLIGACFIAVSTSDNKRASRNAETSTDEEWYSGGSLGSASMSEWTVATDRNQLATSADFATKALELKYGSLSAAMQKLGTMENLRPYAIAVQSCISAAGRQPPETTQELWGKVLQKQTVKDFGALCLVQLDF